MGEEAPPAAKPAVEGPVAPPRRRARLRAAEVIGGGGRELGYFLSPSGISVAADGSLFVCDTLNHRIQKITPQGEVFGLGRRGQGWAEFDRPYGVATDGDRIYVVDSGNHRVQIFSSGGTFIKAFGAKGPFVAFFDAPGGAALDSKGCLYVADTGNDRVQKFRADGDFVAEFGGRLGGFVKFKKPLGVGIGPEDEIYVADTLNNRIVHLRPDGSVKRTLGADVLNDPADVAVDSEGFVYVAERGGGRLVVLDPEGRPFAEISGDGGKVGPFGALLGVALSPDGRVYVTDSTRHRIVGLEWR